MKLLQELFTDVRGADQIVAPTEMVILLLLLHIRADGQYYYECVFLGRTPFRVQFPVNAPRFDE